MSTPEAVLSPASGILLDFDGPVTPLMPPPVNRLAAEATRQPLLDASISLPEEIAATTDHLAVLRYAGHLDPEILREVEAAAVTAEVAAARASQPTPGAHEFLHACRATGKRVVIVSNNSSDAVHTYLNRFTLHRLVHAVIGRQQHRPDLMKPHPSLVGAALHVLDLPAKRCVLIGDSVTDVLVAQATAMPSIGYGKHAQRYAELLDANATAVTANMSALATALTCRIDL